MTLDTTNIILITFYTINHCRKFLYNEISYYNISTSYVDARYKRKDPRINNRVTHSQITMQFSRQYGYYNYIHQNIEMY